MGNMFGQNGVNVLEEWKICMDRMGNIYEKDSH